MTTREEIFLALAKTFLYICGALTAYITTVYHVRKFMEKRSEETSSGISAVIKLIQKDKDIEERMEEIKKEYEDRDDKRGEEIRSLAREIKDFTFQALQLFNINQKK